MSLVTKTLLDIPITISKKDEILNSIKEFLHKPVKKTNQVLLIFTPNPEIIEYSKKDRLFKEIVTKAQINIPDGAGVSWALHYLFNIRVKRIPGVDFTQNILDNMEKEPVRIGLIGGRDDLALRASKCLQSSYKNLKFFSYEAGKIQKSSIRKYVVSTSKKENLESEAKQAQKLVKDIADWIVSNQIAILFLGFGFPKQEFLAWGIKNQVERIKNPNPLIIMTVGGTIDYLSGEKKRAPEWMRGGGLEWMYRLLREPSRIVRQIQGSRFFVRVLTSRNT